MPFSERTTQAGGVPRICINQTGIIVQQHGRFSPTLLHPVFGQRPAFSPAMHQPFQSVSPSLPSHSLHETSSYVPSIAPRVPGKNAAGAPESMHRSKLPLFVLVQHITGPNVEERERQIRTAWTCHEGLVVGRPSDRTTHCMSSQ